MEDSEFETAKQFEETAQKVNPDKECQDVHRRGTDEEDQQEKNSSSEQEQNSNVRNQEEHSLRGEPKSHEAVQETEAAPVRASVEWEIN